MPGPRPTGRRHLWVGLLGVGLLVALATWAGLRAWRPSWPTTENLPRGVARRTDLHVTLRAGGRIDSARRTLIECQLENLEFRNNGRSYTTGASSTILEILDEGTMVRRDDVLCRLDSSAYEELVRDQEIKVEESRSEKLRAELDLEASQLALREYLEGAAPEEQRELQARIVLAQTEATRQADRVDWMQRMVELGYQPRGQLIKEEQSLRRARLNLSLAQGLAENLKRFNDPIARKSLEGRVETAKANLSYQLLRLDRQEERLAYYRRQVEYCTVRAPHDGMVIYANERDDDTRVQLGAIVKQKMDLFYLPDLADMEVHAFLHESVANQVRDGMTARVRVEGLPDYRLEGHVVGVSPLPIKGRDRDRGGDTVRNFLGRIKLHSSPRGLRPGMTAEVEVLTAQRPGALVVPTEALTIEQGREICYVARGDGLERRAVKLGQCTPELLEVTEGLAEGDEVILEPSEVDPALRADADEPSFAIGAIASQ